SGEGCAPRARLRSGPDNGFPPRNPPEPHPPRLPPRDRPRSPAASLPHFAADTPSFSADRGVLSPGSDRRSAPGNRPVPRSNPGARGCAPIHRSAPRLPLPPGALGEGRSARPAGTTDGFRPPRWREPHPRRSVPGGRASPPPSSPFPWPEPRNPLESGTPKGDPLRRSRRNGPAATGGPAGKREGSAPRNRAGPSRSPPPPRGRPPAQRGSIAREFPGRTRPVRSNPTGTAVSASASPPHPPGSTPRRARPATPSPPTGWKPRPILRCDALPSGAPSHPNPDGFPAGETGSDRTTAGISLSRNGTARNQGERNPPPGLPPVPEPTLPGGRGPAPAAPKPA